MFILYYIYNINIIYISGEIQLKSKILVNTHNSLEGKPHD